jgi:hypothetical protein
MIDSRGDDWPEVVQEIKDYLETKGFRNTAEGSGDALERGGTRWWQVSLERKIE